MSNCRMDASGPLFFRGLDFSPALVPLEEGELYWFRDWPNINVPQVCAGLYTIWRNAELVYVGMSGRSLSEESISAHRQANFKNKGLFSRLGSHASGRRSGTSFVCMWQTGWCCPP